METVSFPVEGMTCAACVNRITRFLDNVDGVETASVNLATETATVRFDPERVDVEQLGAAVEAAGYEARTDRAVGDAHEAAIEEVAARARSEMVPPPETSRRCADACFSRRS